MSTQKTGASQLQPANRSRHFWNQLRLEIERTFKDAGSWLVWSKEENATAGPGLAGRYWELLTNDDHDACEREIRTLLRGYTGRESFSPMDDIGELLNQQFSLVHDDHDDPDCAQDGWQYFGDLQAKLMSLCARILVELPILEEVSCTFKKTAEGWSIGFTDDLKSYSDHDGFHYIREIIRCEGKFVDSAELRLLTAAPRPDPIQEQQLIDSGLETTGSEEYTEDDIGESLRNVNRALLEICSPENQERLLREKRWAGIKRRNDNPTGEYDRTAVRDAIESALQKIREEDPKFYDFLNPQIETGQKCRYIEEDIDSVMEWAL